MTKRFRYDTGCVIDQLENKVLSERQAVNHLNALHEENQRLRNDNLTLFALLGDIRALLRTGDVTECIEKINRLEKEMQQ